MRVKCKWIMLVIICIFSLVINKQAEAQDFDATGTWTYSTSNNWVNPGTAGCTVEANETDTVTIT